MKHTVVLRSVAHAKVVLARMQEWVMRRLEAGRRIQLTIGDEERDLVQNAKLHALIRDIADSTEWAGRKWDEEVWKRLLVASWCRAHGENVIVVPALDGSGVDMVPRRTSKLTREECADLLAFTEAWAAEHGFIRGY